MTLAPSRASLGQPRRPPGTLSAVGLMLLGLTCTSLPAAAISMAAG